MHARGGDGYVLSMRISGIVVLIWLLIGLAAAAQRGELTHERDNCSSVATVAVVILAGPLNYLGVNPHVGCRTPRPSSLSLVEGSA